MLNQYPNRFYSTVANSDKIHVQLDYAYAPDLVRTGVVPHTGNWGPVQMTADGALKVVVESGFQIDTLNISGINVHTDQLEDINTSGTQYLASISGDVRFLRTGTNNFSGNVNVLNPLLAVSGNSTITNPILAISGNVVAPTLEGVNISGAQYLASISGDLTYLRTGVSNSTGYANITNPLLAISGNTTLLNPLIAVSGNSTITNPILAISGNTTLTNTLLATSGNSTILNLVGITGTRADVASGYATGYYVMVGGRAVEVASGFNPQYSSGGNAILNIDRVNGALLTEGTDLNYAYDSITTYPAQGTTISNSTISGSFDATALQTGIALYANTGRRSWFIQNTSSVANLFVKLGSPPVSSGSFSLILNMSSAAGAGGGSFTDDRYLGDVSISGQSFIAWELT